MVQLWMMKHHSKGNKKDEEIEACSCFVTNFIDYGTRTSKCTL